MTEFRLLSEYGLQPPVDVDLSEITFVEDDPLFRSIREIGVIQPLLAFRDAESVRLLDGCKRLQAARLLKILELPVLITPETAPDRLIRLRIRSQLASRELNSIEKARLIKQARSHSVPIDESLLRLLRVPGGLVFETENLLTLPKRIQDRIVKLGLSIREAAVLFSFSPGTLAAIDQIAERLCLTKSEFRKLNEILADLVRLENGSAFTELVKLDKAELFSTLNALRSPRWTSQKKTIENQLRSWVQNCSGSIIPPREGDSESFELRIKFTSVEELRQRLREIRTDG